jgi:hypothetical protein
VFSFAPPANNVTSQRARAGRETQSSPRLIAAPYWTELLIFLQNALIWIAGTSDVPRMTQYCAGKGDLIVLLARPQAGGVVRQQPHHVDRDEEGE